MEMKKQVYLIFAGAGASKAVSADRYPTTIEFFEKLPETIRNTHLFKLDE